MGWLNYTCAHLLNKLVSSFFTWNVGDSFFIFCDKLDYENQMSNTDLMLNASFNDQMYELSN